MKPQNFMPYEKLSKKKQREVNAAKRGSWNGLNPVTRVPPNSKAYNRAKARKWRDDLHDLALFFDIETARIL